MNSVESECSCIVSAALQSEGCGQWLFLCLGTVPTIIITAQAFRSVRLFLITGVISTTSAPGFDYETKKVYTLTVTASDGALSDVQTLIVYVEDVNEVPVITAVNNLGDISENEATSRVAVKVDALDPDGDVLIYKLTGSIPAGAPFTIQNSNGELASFLSAYMYMDLAES